jgi:hypothetical protein
MMGTWMIVAAMAACLSFCLAAAAAEPEDGVFSVRSFGAKGDGKQDDTAAFQKALDEAGKAGGGTVRVPRGSYLIGGNLRVPIGVTLEGTFAAPPAHTGIRDKNHPKPGDYGSALLAIAGEGKEDGPAFVSLTHNSTLKGVVIYYPDQKAQEVPQPYPWCIEMRGNNPAVIDVELLNPYQGIDATQNQRHLIRNVHGQPLRRGVLVDQIYDIGRIENVHFNPWWSTHAKLLEWQMQNGEAFVFGRSDWQYVSNTFCYGYKVGYRFMQTKAGVCNGNFLGIGADDCLTAVVAEQTAPFGLLITNGEFVSFRGPEPTMVRVSDGHTGSLRFVNCACWGPNKQIALISGNGTVGFSDCTFMQWDKDKEGRAAIQVKSGTVLVRGCEFREDRPQVELAEGVKRAIVTDNVVTGAVRVINRSKGAVNVSGNVGTK